MKEVVVANKSMDFAGQKFDAPAAPTYFSAKRNADGTWTIQVPDDHPPTPQ